MCPEEGLTRYLFVGVPSCPLTLYKGLGTEHNAEGVKERPVGHKMISIYGMLILMDSHYTRACAQCTGRKEPKSDR